MDKIGVLVFVFNSIPEELLFVIITAFLVGYKDIIKKNLLRVIITALVTALSTVVLRYVSKQLPFVILFQMLFFILSYRYILRMKWLDASLGFFVSIIIYLVLEFTNLTLFTYITGTTMKTYYEHPVLVILITLPQRIMQIIIALVLYKMTFKVINTSAISSFSKNIYKKLSIIHLYFLLAIMQILFIAKYHLLDKGFVFGSSYEIIYMITNLAYVIILTILSIWIVNKLLGDIAQEKRNHRLSLDWFKSLLNEHGNDIIGINKIVDNAIGTNEMIGGERNEEVI